MKNIDFVEERTLAAQAKGWKDVRLCEDDNGEMALIGIPPFPVGDVWGSRFYVPEWEEILKSKSETP